MRLSRATDHQQRHTTRAIRLVVAFGLGVVQIAATSSLLQPRRAIVKIQIVLEEQCQSQSCQGSAHTPPTLSSDECHETNNDHGLWCSQSLQQDMRRRTPRPHLSRLSPLCRELRLTAPRPRLQIACSEDARHRRKVPLYNRANRFRKGSSQTFLTMSAPSLCADCRTHRGWNVSQIRIRRRTM